MALNFPGPYAVRIFYTVSTFVHKMELNCRISGTPSPGDNFPTIDILNRSGGTTQLDAAVDAWVDLIKVKLHTSASIDRAELWKYEPDSFEALFVSTYDISVNGTNGTAPVLASQLVYGFRTEEGGIMKINIMEASQAPGDSVAPANYGAGDAAIAAAVIAANAPWIARDTSYPFASIAFHPGQNERLFKKRYRSS